ncbi:MAG TPA: thioredoxin family protein [Candidatus Polarisedimenticolia bacterium]|nr:thioredoxin family protein [Candidatus Polarisedimenticolia bacterium]
MTARFARPVPQVVFHARLVSLAAFGALAALVTLAAPAVAGEELAIGATGPAFSLKGTDGATHALDTLAGVKGTAVIFTCNECPFAKGYENRLIALAKEYVPLGIGFVAINANDPKVVPGDGFEFMVTRAQAKHFPYPYLIDETQEIAAAYGARVTPHVFLLDAQRKLVYRGRVDDSLEDAKVTKQDFRQALDALTHGAPIPVATTKAFGCSVKWARKGA